MKETERDKERDRGGELPVLLHLDLPPEVLLSDNDEHAAQPKDYREPVAGQGGLDQGVGAVGLELRTNEVVIKIRKRL